MSPEVQRMAIAEVCGFQSGTIQESEPWERWDTVPRTRLVGWRVGDTEKRHEVPDYLTDLNAMHEAEKVLTDTLVGEYGRLLHKSGGSKSELYDDDQFNGWDIFASAHLTAAQRAEAFLRTIGKWTSP